jgi:hypothetical protein
MKSICFPPSALSPRIIAVCRWQENKSMLMGEQIQGEINAPSRYDSKLQTRPALEAVNTGEHAIAWTLIWKAEE